VDDAAEDLPQSPPRGDFRAMPALGGGFAMLKWISSFPGNPAEHGLPDGDGGRAASPMPGRARRGCCSTRAR
jgi:ornithine cyclodeaminase/alanine dehydrogenase-like protein (mu-crystallin family)